MTVSSVSWKLAFSQGVVTMAAACGLAAFGLVGAARRRPLSRASRVGADR